MTVKPLDDRLRQRPNASESNGDEQRETEPQGQQQLDADGDPGRPRSACPGNARRDELAAIRPFRRPRSRHLGSKRLGARLCDCTPTVAGDVAMLDDNPLPGTCGYDRSRRRGRIRADSRRRRGVRTRRRRRWRRRRGCGCTLVVVLGGGSGLGVVVPALAAREAAKGYAAAKPSASGTTSSTSFSFRDRSRSRAAPEKALCGLRAAALLPRCGEPPKLAPNFRL